MEILFMVFMVIVSVMALFAVLVVLRDIVQEILLARREREKASANADVIAAAEKIVALAKRNGAEISGPVPLPTDREITTILRAVHKYKDSREQFELKTHKRLIDIIEPSEKAIDALMSVELPAGVEIEVKL